MRRTAAALVVLLASLASIAHAATSYQVNSGASTNITEHSTCKSVTNNHASGLAIFVPTATNAEWTAFYSNPPSGVTIGTCGPTHVYFNSGVGVGSWTVPAGVTALTLECVGGGGNASGHFPPGNGGGGGGGAYAKTNTVAVTAGNTIYYSVGFSGAANDTWARYNNNTAPSSTSDGCLADSGIQSPAGGAGGAGGTAASSVGDVKYSGGNGGASDGINNAGGGGGSAGPSGSGVNGASGSTTSNGGTANNGSGGTGGTGTTGAASPGNSGTEWDASHGTGGGGGGGRAGTGAGGNGGLSGGGAGAAANSSAGYGTGARGLVVITY